MANDTREQRLARTFVELADTLVEDFDVLEFLGRLSRRCAELLDVDAAGVVLVDEDGGLGVAAASCENSGVIELFAAQTDEGPCRDCARGGLPVSSVDLVADAGRWPRFTEAAGEAGFQAAHAIPMRLRQHVVGVVTLLNTAGRGVEEAGMRLGQALADVATIGLLQQRAIGDGVHRVEQLQTALNSRVVIEQAKGVLSAHAGIDMEQAFAALRGYARANNRRLSEFVRTVADGTADLDAIAARARR